MIEAEKGKYPVAFMCRQLGVSRSGFYAWCKRTPSQRTLQDALLVDEIKASHEQSRGTYGSPRVVKDLKERGIAVGRRRVARLMRRHGISGRRPRRFRKTTDSAHGFAVAANVLDRQFDVDRPDKVWATDITYIRTWEGWMYLAVVVDLFSRRVVGWSMANHLRTSLVLKALQMALGRRSPQPELLHHSDRGCQYASRQYRQQLEQRGIVCSMSRKGDCWDNAVVESFFATLKKELIHRRPWTTIRATRTAIADYIEIFYNRKRRHSSLGYCSPVDYEQGFEQQAARAA